MRKLVLLSICWITLSCGKELPHLQGIDLKAWKTDRGGCHGERTSFIEPMTSQKDLLKALDEMQIVELLGRPDQNELYTRKQKFYIYLMEPGPACANKKEKPKQLVIRFNAMGFAKEVYVE